MRRSALRRRPTPVHVAPFRPLPTVLLAREDHGAVRDALDALPDAAAARERTLDTIELLDTVLPDVLGADALGGLHLPPDDVRAASDADARATGASLVAALFGAIASASRTAPPH